MREKIKTTQRRRALFCSYHCLLDPSSGAAIATRDLLRAMAGWGWECHALCGPQLDFERPEQLPQIVSDSGLPAEVSQAGAGRLYRVDLGGVRVDLHAGPEGAFLSSASELLARFRPHLLLTYGGQPVGRRVMDLANRNNIPVVFGLHNFAYRDARLFRPARAVLVPSECSATHYRRLGLSPVTLPHPLDWERFHAPPEGGGRYVTFVNPQPSKGVFWFARIAEVLARRRPDIPLLVVEGRGGTEWLSRAGLRPELVPNLHMMASTPDSRDFYRVSRLILMPSLGRESFGLVAAEASANGIPVLASDRGALPEVLAEAGLLLNIPEEWTPERREMPSPGEVEPWVSAVTRLWDRQDRYEEESVRSRRAAQAWSPDRLHPAYEALFRSVLG